MEDSAVLRAVVQALDTYRDKQLGRDSEPPFISDSRYTKSASASQLAVHILLARPACQALNPKSSYVVSPLGLDVEGR